MLLLMWMFILLNASTGDVDPSTANSLVEYLLGIGITGVAALVFGFLWWRTNNKLNSVKEQEVKRLVQDKKEAIFRADKDKEAAESQVNILWTELNKSKNEEVEKYNILTQALNETQLQTVNALRDSTDVVKANTEVMDKNRQIMNKHMDTYEKFIDILLQKAI